MKTPLERLYARRLKLDQERGWLNKLIAKLERRGTYVAIAKIHHATEGCSLAWLGRPTQTPWGYRSKVAKKTTKNWKIVDCMKCLRHRGRQRGRRVKPIVPWTAPRRAA